MKEEKHNEELLDKSRREIQSGRLKIDESQGRYGGKDRRLQETESRERKRYAQV